MSSDFTVRAIEATDHDNWLGLWQGYLDFYHVELDDQISQTTWQRLLDPKIPQTGSLLAISNDGKALGFLNYVTHLITWAEEPGCYLEDLYVDPDTRGKGVARALIEALTEMGRKNKWHRIYWHTARDNVPAQVLYNKVAERTGWVRYDIDLD